MKRSPIALSLRRVPMAILYFAAIMLAPAGIAAQSADDERAIREVLMALPEAWNARDAAA
ncbi:MAG: hypothetical protein OXQ31_06240 [Spirochaetaceae bacterium]|nr:hypothetical protein [Spirochaetaceae bacterium]